MFFNYFFDIYYKLYLESNKSEQYYLNKLSFYKEKCEQNSNYTLKIKKEIEDNLSQINNTIKPIEIP